MTPPASFDERIGRLDLSLFSAIHSQSDDGDKRSWLALQRAARSGERGSYCFLEIGSYLGGSLQPHLLDPRCRRILSIDNRPAEPPDSRGTGLGYPDNSTARMMANLRAVDAAATGKIDCFEADARDLDPAGFADRPDLCFIDGEHTEQAVASDFLFCLRAAAPEVVVYFHDDWVIHPALSAILRGLRAERRPHRAFKLGGSTFAIALGTRELPPDGELRRSARNAAAFLFRLRLRALLLRSLPGPALRAVRAAKALGRRVAAAAGAGGRP